MNTTYLLIGYAIGWLFWAAVLSTDDMQNKRLGVDAALALAWPFIAVLMLGFKFGRWLRKE
jgi:hypothetical protein